MNEKLAEYWYVPKKYEKEETTAKPTYLLKPLSGTQLLTCQNPYGGGPNLLKVLMIGLKNWENVQVKGKPLAFAVENVDELPLDLLSELASELFNNSHLTEYDQKNL